MAALLLVAIAVAVVLIARPRGKTDVRHHTATVLDHAVKSEKPVAIGGDATTSATGATSAREAVQSYLDAERLGRSADSYQMLSAADRSAIGSESDWSDGVDGRPHITSYELDTTTTDPIVTEVQLAALVDEINGVVPSAATITWKTVQVSGYWFVDLGHSKFVAHYPDEQGAVATALTWVQAQQACDVGPQYAGSLIGQPDLAAGLCHKNGAFTAGAPTTLDTFIDPLAITTAFGPDAPAWARVVTLDGPDRLEVVTAPLGDHWVVVGIGHG